VWNCYKFLCQSQGQSSRYEARRQLYDVEMVHFEGGQQMNFMPAAVSLSVDPINLVVRITMVTIYLYIASWYCLYSLYRTHPCGIWLIFSSMGMTLNYFHIFIVTGSFLYMYWCVMRPASQHPSYTVLFIYESWSYLISQSFLALIAFLCWCAVQQSINQSTSQVWILLLCHGYPEMFQYVNIIYIKCLG